MTTTFQSGNAIAEVLQRRHAMRQHFLLSDYLGHPRLPTLVALAGCAFVIEAGISDPLGTNQTTTRRSSEDGPDGTEEAQKLESKPTPC